MKDLDHGDWTKILDAEKKAHKDYRERAINVRKVYELEGEHKNNPFNVFWANVDVMHGALFSRPPVPDVRRRYQDDNPVGRDAATVIQRALEFSLDAYPFDVTADVAIDDFLITALGQIRVVYDAYVTEGSRPRLPLMANPDGTYTGMDGQPHEGEVHHDGEDAFSLGEPESEITYQAVTCRAVPWDRFRWAPAKDWASVWWVGEEHYLTKDEIEEQFVIEQDQLDAIDYGYTPIGQKSDAKKGENADEADERALVIEIWDRNRRQRFAYVDGRDMLLKFKTKDGVEAADDPLELKNFYPYPMPLVANVLSGNFVPKPDYLYYQEQAQELNEISKRISFLVSALKYRGVYDANFPKLSEVTDGGDNTFVPVENYAQRFSDKGLESVIAAMPITEIMKVVEALLLWRDQVKQVIYELTGIADIARGATSPSETLGAQQLKAQFTGIRIGRKQRRVEDFLRDVLRIKAEIIAEHFEPHVLRLMTGIEVTNEIMMVLKSDVLREFAVDVETDSTIMRDASIEANNRSQIVLALITALEKAGPILAPLGPQGLELLKQVVLFGLSGYKEADEVERIFDQLWPAVEQAQQQAAAANAPPPEPPPDPEEVEHTRAIRGEELAQARAKTRQANAGAGMSELELQGAQNGMNDVMQRLNGGENGNF